MSKKTFNRPSHLFISSSDAGLYDTRRKDWHKQPPLRPDYMKHFSVITNTAELLATLRAGPSAWPGGYPLYFITSDGGALSFATVQKNLRRVLSSIRDQSSDGWQVVACDVNWEDAELFDDHTGEKIPSAYAE